MKKRLIIEGVHKAREITYGEKESNLSSTIYKIHGVEVCQTEHIKDFIRLLKEEINSNWLGENKQYVGRVFVLTWINKLAGKELVE